MAVNESNTVAEIDAYAEELGIEVTGTKAEKLDQIEAHLADQAPDDEPEDEAPADTQEIETVEDEGEGAVLEPETVNEVPVKERYSSTMSAINRQYAQRNGV